jgi:hypothetical protein
MARHGLHPDHGGWKGDISPGMRNPPERPKGFLHWGKRSEPSPASDQREAPSPLRTSAKHVQRISRNTLGMPEVGSFAARGGDEIPPDRVLPHPITSPRERAAPGSALPPCRTHRPKSIRADLLACVALDDEAPQSEAVVARTTLRARDLGQSWGNGRAPGADRTARDLSRFRW